MEPTPSPTAATTNQTNEPDHRGLLRAPTSPPGREGRNKTSDHKHPPTTRGLRLNARESRGNLFSEGFSDGENPVVVAGSTRRETRLLSFSWRPWPIMNAKSNRTDDGRAPRMGRPRKPTKLKILEGNPGRRPLNTSEPEYEPKIPKPSDLTPLASAWWDLVVPQLVRVGLAQSVDGPSLALLAEDFSGWKGASLQYTSMSRLVSRGSTKVPVLDAQGRTDLGWRRRGPTSTNRATSHSRCQSFAPRCEGLRRRLPSRRRGVRSHGAVTLNPVDPGPRFRGPRRGFRRMASGTPSARRPAKKPVRRRPEMATRDDGCWRSEVTDLLLDAEHREEFATGPGRRLGLPTRRRI